MSKAAISIKQGLQKGGFDVTALVKQKLFSKIGQNLANINDENTIKS